MMAAVDAQIASLQQVAGDGLEHRTWGEQNTAAIRHPLSRAVPLLASWLDMKSEPLSGDTHMPKALGPDFGASERFAVAPGDEHNAYMHIPAGQSGHPMSDYYRMGHDDWVQVRPSPFLPGKTAHSLILDPESL
jgi:penicillin amidase